MLKKPSVTNFVFSLFHTSHAFDLFDFSVTTTFILQASINKSMLLSCWYAAFPAVRAVQVHAHTLVRPRPHHTPHPFWGDLQSSHLFSSATSVISAVCVCIIVIT